MQNDNTKNLKKTNSGSGWCALLIILVGVFIALDIVSKSSAAVISFDNTSFKGGTTQIGVGGNPKFPDTKLIAAIRIKIKYAYESAAGITGSAVESSSSGEASSGSAGSQKSVASKTDGVDKWSSNTVKYSTYVRVTSYNPEVGQNDSSPCIGAHGTNVCQLARSGIRTLAVSQDMRWKYKYGTTVWVESENPSIKGCYQVEDTMNKRWKNRIDLFFMTRKENQGGYATIVNSICNPRK
jgi:3D (Asp-Asp-Asp) domain-containing protein